MSTLARATRAHYIRLAFTCGVVGVACASLWAAGCSAPDASARVDAVGPNRAQFTSVAPMLVRRCGSIDCHGSRFRNLRVYGYGGQRRDGGLRPDEPAKVTDDEADATYESIVGLEPEIMRAVVQSGGAGPERLSFVRKARGDEDHKGDRRVARGDDSDRCILTWLANAVDVDACARSGCLVPVGDTGSTIIGSCP